MARLSALLTTPLTAAQKAFVDAPNAFREWVFDTADLWVYAGDDGERVLRSIRLLTALPKPTSVRDPHPLDGIVTWRGYSKGGFLNASYIYRAKSIYHAVTAGMSAAHLEFCRGYTPQLIVRASEYFVHNSVRVGPGQTAEQVKTRYKEHFRCSHPGCTSLGPYDVDHVNPKCKTQIFAMMIKNCSGRWGPCCVARELSMTQPLCVQHHRAKDVFEKANGLH